MKSIAPLLPLSFSLCFSLLVAGCEPEMSFPCTEKDLWDEVQPAYVPIFTNVALCLMIENIPKNAEKLVLSSTIYNSISLATVKHEMQVEMSDVIGGEVCFNNRALDEYEGTELASYEIRQLSLRAFSAGKEISAANPSVLDYTKGASCEFSEHPIDRYYNKFVVTSYQIDIAFDFKDPIGGRDFTLTSSLLKAGPPNVRGQGLAGQGPSKR